MPNYVRNRIVLNGTLEQIQAMYDKFNTHIPAKIAKTHDGLIRCKNPNTVLSKYGYFNPHTGGFYNIEGEYIQNGLPEGWEMVVEQSADYFPDFSKIIPPPDNIINKGMSQAEIDEYEKQGIPTWYYWNRENWGTKWNAHATERESINTFTFETAWSSVPKIVAEMSRQFPEVSIEYLYADEDTGYNCGEYEYKAGEVIRHYIPKGGSKEAYDIAFKLFPEYKED